jgi:hypothetical protein
LCAAAAFSADITGIRYWLEEPGDELFVAGDLDFELGAALPPFFTTFFLGAVFFTAVPSLALIFLVLLLLLMFVATAETSSASLPPTIVAMQASSSSSEPESLSLLAAAGGVLRFLVVVALAATFLIALPLFALDFALVAVLLVLAALFIMRRNSFPLGGPGFGLIIGAGVVVTVAVV